MRYVVIAIIAALLVPAVAQGQHRNGNSTKPPVKSIVKTTTKQAKNDIKLIWRLRGLRAFHRPAFVCSTSRPWIKKARHAACGVQSRDPHFTSSVGYTYWRSKRGKVWLLDGRVGMTDTRNGLSRTLTFLPDIVVTRAEIKAARAERDAERAEAKGSA